MGLERRGRPAPVDPVAVAPRLCGTASIEVGRNLLDTADRHVVGELGVQRLRRSLRRRSALGFDARHLPEGMDARVCASGD